MCFWGGGAGRGSIIRQRKHPTADIIRMPPLRFIRHQPCAMQTCVPAASPTWLVEQLLPCGLLQLQELKFDNNHVCLCICCVQEHAATGCSGQLAFHIEDLFGSDSLTCSCALCNTLSVVV